MLEIINVKEEVYDDILYLIDAIKNAAENKNTKTANAMVIGLIYTLKQVRKLRRYEHDFREAMEELYLED